jgi:hypothetical protein
MLEDYVQGGNEPVQMTLDAHSHEQRGVRANHHDLFSRCAQTHQINGAV